MNDKELRAVELSLRILGMGIVIVFLVAALVEADSKGGGQAHDPLSIPDSLLGIGDAGTITAPGSLYVANDFQVSGPTTWVIGHWPNDDRRTLEIAVEDDTVRVTGDLPYDEAAKKFLEAIGRAHNCEGGE